MFVKEFQELDAIKGTWQRRRSFMADMLRTVELDPFTPDYVYETLRKLKKFDSLRGRQEDADEFLGSLLDTLHEEFDTGTGRCVYHQARMLIRPCYNQRDANIKRI